ncbi:MAG TPA: hypothetical protein VMV94_11595 [Phycisphaerae bacterium]|nr:hypothetical protein [Phycisphaerae bacterium]
MFFSNQRHALIFGLALVCSMATAPAMAWDEEGHITVAHLAAVKLPDTMPDWVRTPEVRSRLEYLSSEPDRWRGQHSIFVDHYNNPDHYMDEEQLHVFDLTFKTLPPLERQLLDRMAAERALHPDKFKPYDPKEDPAYTNLVPGLLPYRISQLQWLIAADWTTLKTYEKHPDQVTSEMVRNARENIVYNMGIISHLVGDGAQPLHVTQHHHGWVGPNPKGYTTEKGFHSFIDGGVISLHHITPESLAERARPPRKTAKEDSWKVIGDYLDETYQQVEPLYELEKSGELKKEPGKKFIEDRLLDGGAMLAGVWVAAYEAGTIDEYREKQLAAKAHGPQTTQAEKPAQTPAEKPAEKKSEEPVEKK